MGQKVTREELYNLVWKSPITLLAKDYCMSDVGFSKVCKKLNIPLPPRGYWARVRSGQKVKTPPLPKPNKDTLLFHHFDFDNNSIKATHLSSIGNIRQIPDGSYTFVHLDDQTPSYTREAIEDATKLINKIKTEIRNFKISKTFFPADIKISETNEALLLAKLNGRERATPYRKDYFNICVSHDMSSRAMVILNEIYILVYKFEGQFTQLNTYHSNTSSNIHGISFFGENIQFFIEEKSKRSDYIPNKEDIRKSIESWRTYPKYTYTPSGEITFRIDFPVWGNHGLRKSWTDKNNRKLEEQIPDILIGCILAATALRIKKGEEQEKLKLQEAQSQEIRRKEEKRKNELEYQQHLEEMALSWKKSQTIREFVRETEELALYKFQNKIPPSLKFWINRARAYADKIDPALAIIKEHLDDKG